MPNDEKQAARRAIINKHCRMQTGGRAGTPKFCHPTRDQVIRAAGKGHPAQRRPPIIFDSIEAAQACADELEELDGIKLTVYPCPRSNRGHAHLSGHSNEGTNMAKIDPKDLAYAARTTKGLIYDILVSSTRPQNARELRTMIDLLHEAQVIPDWPRRGGMGVPRQHAFDAALVELVAAGVVEQADDQFGLTSTRAAQLREFADAQGEQGFRQDELAAAFEWPDPAEINVQLQLARECGAIVRPHERGRFYAIKHAPTSTVEVVVGYSAYRQDIPPVEVEDHKQNGHGGYRAVT